MCDSRTTFPRNFITARYIYYVNDIVSQFPAEIGCQVICRRNSGEHAKLLRSNLISKVMTYISVIAYYKQFCYRKYFTQFKNIATIYLCKNTSSRFTKKYICLVQVRKLLKGSKINTDVLPNCSMWAAPSFYCTNPFLWKCFVFHQELTIFFSEYIVCHLKTNTSFSI